MSEQLRLFDERLWRASSGGHPLVVRTSRRARRLVLRFVPPHTLELVVPRGARPREVVDFVAEHQSWIDETRAEIAKRYGAGAERLPDRIDLRAIGRVWQVRYRTGVLSAQRARITDDGYALSVTSPDDSSVGGARLLRRWLLRQAGRSLKPWLLEEARLVGHSPSTVQVRFQRTRWGSCSPQGCISLNAGLLFLEPAVVRYLLIHELCHLRWMNHSKRYWAHVARFEPDYERLDRLLAGAWGEVPLWAHAPA